MQIKLNKSSLSHEQKNLKNYKQFLPALDLKRLKLLIEKNKAKARSIDLQAQFKKLSQHLGKVVPMAAYQGIDLEQLIKIESIDITHENIVGTKLPLLKSISFTTTDYSLFNSPHWLDDFIRGLKEYIELQMQCTLAEKRVGSLENALQIVTQRKNLFEKVLIPKAVTDIRTIQIYLADNERAAVVRSKLAKKKRQLT